MNLTKKNETSRVLRVVYTDAERLDLGRKLAESHYALAQIAADFEMVKTSFKSKTSAKEAEIADLSTKVSTGFRLDPVRCLWEMDQPSAGRKTLRRPQDPPPSRHERGGRSRGHDAEGQAGRTAADRNGRQAERGAAGRCDGNGHRRCGRWHGNGGCRQTVSTETIQDSRPDTLAHIWRVRQLIDDCAQKLYDRGLVHDDSKLVEPEKSAFDRLKALSLSGMAYGSEEYRACLRAEKPAIEHHYKANSHHPEFYENGVDGMSLFDVLEMLMDWKAATERMKNGGDIHASLVHNTERFKLSPQLAAILANTIREMEWPKP